MDHQFRSVAFGGFHKQDVLNFVENTAKDHAQQLQELAISDAFEHVAGRNGGMPVLFNV